MPPATQDMSVDGKATEGTMVTAATVMATISAAGGRASLKSFSTDMTPIGPPQANAPHASLCKKGPRRERQVQAFTAKDCGRLYRGEMPWSRPRDRRRPTLMLLAGLVLLVSSSGCSAETDADKAGRTSRLTGKHFLTCDGGRKLSVEFVGDGLTIDLATLPNGTAERLTAPAAGVTYFGDYVNLAISDGAVVVMRAGVPPQICRWDGGKRGGQPPP